MDTESRVCPFGMVQIGINDLRSVRSWCLKGSDESTLGKGSTVPLMLDCSQPLCISMHAKEKASAKHARMGMGMRAKRAK